MNTKQKRMSREKLVSKMKANNSAKNMQTSAQHRSKPGQRRQQQFWGHVTADQNVFKIKNL